jgi:hypothetical protein
VGGIITLLVVPRLSETDRVALRKSLVCMLPLAGLDLRNIQVFLTVSYPMICVVGVGRSTIIRVPVYGLIFVGRSDSLAIHLSQLSMLGAGAQSEQHWKDGCSSNRR